MQQSLSKPGKSRMDEARLNALKELIAAKFYDLLGDLSTDLKHDGIGFRGPCPVHGGDNQSAILLYTDGQISTAGYWRCYTKKCQEVFGSTLLGFVRGALSHARKGWGQKGDKEFSFRDTVSWACRTLRVRFDELNAAMPHFERQKFTKAIQTVQKQWDGFDVIPREQFSHLRTPSPYFLGREFKAETLRHFAVGDSPPGDKPMSGRAVVPILNENGDAIGFTGRSLYDQCSTCLAYHPPKVGCPADDASRRMFAKWTNSKGLRTDSLLFNWAPLRASRRPRIVTLVEGPPDVMRVWEAGFDVVGLLKAELSDNQQVILETGGVLGVILGLDDDGPGREASAKIRSQLERSFYVANWAPPGGDPGDSPVELIQNTLGPIVEKMLRNC